MTLHFRAFIIIFCLAANSLAATLPVNANHDKIHQILKTSGLRFAELEGLGFGIEPEGPHALNKISQNILRRFDVHLVIDTRRGDTSVAFYGITNQAIFMRQSPEELVQLLSWEPSRIQSVLLHEVRHVYLRKSFDEKEVITAFSGFLKNKDVDPLNPYAKFLSFQEYSTFSLELRQLSGQAETLGPSVYKSLLESAATMHQFSVSTLEAIVAFQQDLETSKVWILETKDKKLDVWLKYLELQSADRIFSFLIPKNQALKTPQDKIQLAKLRLESLKLAVQAIETPNLTLIEELRRPNEKMDRKKIKDLIQKISEAGRRGYAPAPMCRQIFL